MISTDVSTAILHLPIGVVLPGGHSIHGSDPPAVDAEPAAVLDDARPAMMVARLISNHHPAHFSTETPAWCQATPRRQVEVRLIPTHSRTQGSQPDQTRSNASPATSCTPRRTLLASRPDESPSTASWSHSYPTISISLFTRGRKMSLRSPPDMTQNWEIALRSETSGPSATDLFNERRPTF